MSIRTPLIIHRQELRFLNYSFIINVAAVGVFCLKSSANPVYYGTDVLETQTAANNRQAGQRQAHENPVKDH